MVMKNFTSKKFVFFLAQMLQEKHPLVEYCFQYNNS